MHSRQRNEMAGGGRGEVRSVHNGWLAFKALLYFAAGILGIDWVARITMGH